jgi:coatomer subunit beta
MKVFQRSQAHTIGLLDQKTIRASIKVSSTETGHIFGTIVYTNMALQEQKLIRLNNIHMDIMDNIRPASIIFRLFSSNHRSTSTVSRSA